MRSMILAAALLASPVYAQVVSAEPEAAETCGCGKSHALRLRAAAGLPVCDGQPPAAAAPGYGQREALTDTDVLGYTLDIEVNPTTEVISGSNTIHVRSLVNGLTQFTFLLRNNYTVSQVLLNGTTPASATTPPANSYARRVTLDRAYNTGEEFTVRIAYSGTAVSRGFGSIEVSPTSVETLSEAYFAATWWPVKDGDVFLPGDNSDKATVDLSVTAPSAFRTVSNGLLQSITPVAGGKSKYRWVTNYPTSTYLVCFNSRVYNTWTQTYSYPLDGGGTGTMPVEFNIDPASDSPFNRYQWEKCLDMMAAYRPFYGEYPFVNEKYGIYQFNFGGGMEHQTNTGQGTWNEGVTAHELGHQYWGDNVTCKTWSDIWLNEGFATYTECLWAEHAPGSSGLPAYLDSMLSRKPSPTSNSVYVYDTADMGRIFSSNYTYNKGAWALHQLRHIVGDSTFYQILQTYRAAFQGSGATTDDFATVASGVSGRDLIQFFQQCVYGIGAPAYTMGTQPVTINGSDYLRISLRQTQNATWPGAGAPAGVFAFPVDLRVDTAAGSATVALNNTARTQHFLVPADSPVTGVALDEFQWILRTTAVGSEAYQAGPPKIIAASPAPLSAAEASIVDDVTVTFSEPVSITAPSMTLVGPAPSTSQVASTFAYSPATQTATVTPTAPLSPGVYTLTVAPTVTAVSGGAALDGEYPGTQLVAGDAFPTGDGLAGGASSWTFIITTPLCGTADFNGDGDIGTDADIEAFFACLGGDCCATCFAGGSDFDGDGDTGTDADIEAFFRVLAGGNC